MYKHIVPLVDAVNKAVDPRFPSSCRIVTMSEDNHIPEVKELYAALSVGRAVQFKRDRMGSLLLKGTQIPIEMDMMKVPSISTRYGKLKLDRLRTETVV